MDSFDNIRISHYLSHYENIHLNIKNIQKQNMKGSHFHKLHTIVLMIRHNIMKGMKYSNCYYGDNMNFHKIYS